MTSRVHPDPVVVDEQRAGADVVVTFTNRGERALDHLAAVITNRMARTPEDIAATLAMVYQTPLDELAAALQAIADCFPDEHVER
jgi:hypothetical protein